MARYRGKIRWIKFRVKRRSAGRGRRILHQRIAILGSNRLIIRRRWISTRPSGGKAPTNQAKDRDKPLLCKIVPPLIKRISQRLPDDRIAGLRAEEFVWPKGEVLTYVFLKDGKWGTSDKEQMKQVEKAMNEWKTRTGMDLDFQPIGDREDSLLRIGFCRTDGSWSYVGTENRKVSKSMPTMNFGWDLTTRSGYGTALHELGHALGLFHAHQNPRGGIKWNEAAVYEDLGNPPNNWDKETTYNNIIHKNPPGYYYGDDWNPKSIMEYAFDPTLISAPSPYDECGIDEPLQLDQGDIEVIKKLYGDEASHATSTLHHDRWVRLDADLRQQDFVLEPGPSGLYTIETSGNADTHLDLYVQFPGLPHKPQLHVARDEDTGESRNARITINMLRPLTYVLKVRSVWQACSGESTVRFRWAGATKEGPGRGRGSTGTHRPYHYFPF